MSPTMPQDESVPARVAQRGERPAHGMFQAETGQDLGVLRCRAGLTYRALAGLAGIDLARAHRTVNDVGRVRHRDLVAVRQILRTTEPALLHRIREIAVPFLEERFRA